MLLCLIAPEDNCPLVEVVSSFCAPFGSFGAGKDLVGPSLGDSLPATYLDLASMDLMGESREGLDVTFEVTSRKVKGRRELKNLECSIKYDAKGTSTRRGEASLLFSSFVCLVSLGLCCFVGFGLEGLPGVGFVGGFFCVWSLLCILLVYLGAALRF
jgi:hypothetical protein